MITQNYRQLQNNIERHPGITNVLYCEGNVKGHKLDMLAKTTTLM
jgi:hypothetical protein